MSVHAAIALDRVKVSVDYNRAKEVKNKVTSF